MIDIHVLLEIGDRFGYLVFDDGDLRSTVVYKASVYKGGFTSFKRFDGESRYIDAARYILFSEDSK